MSHTFVLFIPDYTFHNIPPRDGSKPESRDHHLVIG
jgi:hypothetical protein